MFPPAIIYLLIQLVGLYGAFRFGSETTYCKGNKKELDPFRGGIGKVFQRDPVNAGMIAAFLGISLIIAMTNVSTFGGGYGGGGYGGGYGMY